MPGQLIGWWSSIAPAVAKNKACAGIYRQQIMKWISRYPEKTVCIERTYLSPYKLVLQNVNLFYYIVGLLVYCVLYCIVLYCIVLYCIVLYCIVLYCIVLYCIVLYCIVLYCIVLYLLLAVMWHPPSLDEIYVYLKPTVMPIDVH